MNSALFDLRDLTVSGNHRLSAAEVARAAGLTSGTNLLWTSTGGIEAKLEANPWVREAHVSRTLPSALEVRILERTPVAVVSPGSLLVAGDGTVLGTAATGGAAGLPHVALSGAPPTVGQVLRSLPQLVAAGAMPGDVLHLVKEIVAGPNGTLQVVTRAGVPVVFGDETDAAAKWEALRGILQWARKNDVQALYIDVRSPIAPALRPVAPPGPGSER